MSLYAAKPCASVSLGAFRDEENWTFTPQIHGDTISLDKPNVRHYLLHVTSNPMSEAARIMGSARTPRKAKTSRENGKLGGRPPKKKKTKGKKAA